MKTKYQRMTKEEKKKLLIDYKKTEKGKYIMEKLRNALICGILLYAYAIYMLVTAKNIWSYIGAGGLFLFGCIFIVVSIRLKIKNLTKFAVNRR